MKVSIYLPDELHTELKDRPSINVSAVCQTALRAELAKHTKFSDDMSPQVEYCTERGRRVQFMAKHIASVDGLELFLTARHRWALYNRHDQILSDYDNLDEIREIAPDLINQVVEVLGPEYDDALEIDI